MRGDNFPFFHKGFSLSTLSKPWVGGFIKVLLYLSRKSGESETRVFVLSED